MLPDMHMDMIDDSGSGELDGVRVSLACPSAIQPGTAPSSNILESLGHLALVDDLGMKQVNDHSCDFN